MKLGPGYQTSCQLNRVRYVQYVYSSISHQVMKEALLLGDLELKVVSHISQVLGLIGN